MDRLHELFLENREEHGLLPARKMAMAQRQTELMEELVEEQLTTEEKIDKIIKVLEIMHMRDK